MSSAGHVMAMVTSLKSNHSQFYQLKFNPQWLCNANKQFTI